MKIVTKILALVLSLTVMLVPMTLSVGAAKGDYDDMYVLNVGASLTVDIPAEATVYVQASNSNGSTVNASANAALTNVILYCRQIVEASGKTASFQMVSDVNWFSMYNSGTQTIRVTLKLTAGQAQDTTGTVNNPEVLTLEENPRTGALGAYVSKALKAENEGYYYKVIAPGEGAVNVSVSAYDDNFNDMGWTFFANNVTQGKYGDRRQSDDDPIVNNEQIPVRAGDEVVVFAATYNPAKPFNNPAGNISVTISFSEKGSSDYPATPVVGANAAAIKNGSGYNYTYTAAKDGTVTVTMNDASGWQYMVSNITQSKYGDTHWSDDDPVMASESIAVKAGDTVHVTVNTYNPNNPFAGPSGTVNWTFAFEAGEGGNDDNNPGGNGGNNPGGDLGGEEEINYAISDMALELGTKDYPVDAVYPYTVYSFSPDEKGVYTISTADGVIGIVSYIDMWVQHTPSEDNVNATEVEWSCNSVGQGIYVAVKTDSDTATITVTREELVEKEEVPWIIYENTVTPEAFVLESVFEDMMYVDTFDDVDDKAVLGEDGFYHLNDKYGPILYACLSDPLMNLSDAWGYGQLKEVLVDENGNIVERTDFYYAFEEYFNCTDPDTGVYPLTADIIEMFTRIGAYHNWYGESGFIGGDLDDAWMFACYYNEGEEFEPAGSTAMTTTTTTAITTTTAANATETTTTAATGSPSTADASDAMNVVLLAILAAGVIAMTAVSKKATVR